MPGVASPHGWDNLVVVIIVPTAEFPHRIKLGLEARRRNMGDIINLNRVRKERERAERRKPGARHVKAGLNKSERTELTRDSGRSESDLDGKKLDRDPKPPTAPGSHPSQDREK